MPWRCPLVSGSAGLTGDPSPRPVARRVTRHLVAGLDRADGCGRCRVGIRRGPVPPRTRVTTSVVTPASSGRRPHRRLGASQALAARRARCRSSLSWRDARPRGVEGIPVEPWSTTLSMKCSGVSLLRCRKPTSHPSIRKRLRRFWKSVNPIFRPRVSQSSRIYLFCRIRSNTIL